MLPEPRLNMHDHDRGPSNKRMRMAKRGMRRKPTVLPPSRLTAETEFINVDLNVRSRTSLEPLR